MAKARGGGGRRWWRWAAGGALAAALLAGVLVAGGLLGPGLRALPRWEPGQAYRYRLAYRATERVGLLGDAGDASGRADVEGRFDVAATLVLGVLRGEPGGQAGGGRSLLLLTLERPSSARFEFMGQPLVPEEEARARLVAGEALLTLGPGGQVEEVRFAPAAPALFQRTVLAVLSELRLDLRAGEAAWRAGETGQRGAGETAWTARRGRTADVATRVKAPYARLHAVPEGLAGLAQALDARLEVEVTPGGRLRRLAGRERLSLATPAHATRLAAETDTSLLLEEVRPLAAPEGLARLREQALARHAAVAPARLEDPSPSAGSRRALQEQVASVDLAAMRARLALLAAGHPLPDDFMWRAGTWLQLHPEGCAALAALFAEPGTAPRVRQAIVALLVQAATPEAQEALRDLLAAPAARALDGWPRLLTQLTYLQAPEPETLELLAEVAGAEGPGRTAATMALGAAISRARGDEAGALAGALDRRLAAELATAGGPERQAVLLASLANAERVENVPAVLPFASAPEAQVRIAAADALGRTPTPEGLSALERLAVDRELPVQGAAIVALARHPPGDQGLERLAALVRAGAVHELSFPTLLNLAEASRAAGAPAASIRALLAAMSAARIDRPEIRRVVDDALAKAP